MLVVTPCTVECPQLQNSGPALPALKLSAHATLTCYPVYLPQLLHSRGVDLVRVEMIPDDKRDIVETVLRLRERVGDGGFVFTSGGIGTLGPDGCRQCSGLHAV